MWWYEASLATQRSRWMVATNRPAVRIFATDSRRLLSYIYLADLIHPAGPYVSFVNVPASLYLHLRIP